MVRSVLTIQVAMRTKDEASADDTVGRARVGFGGSDQNDRALWKDVHERERCVGIISQADIAATRNTRGRRARAQSLTSPGRRVSSSDR